MPGKLFLCATPIGNLGDMTPRVIETLNMVDVIAAEDTRNSIKLLNHFDIKKPLVSYYEHNLRQKGDYIIQRVLAGETCAVCSDAGTPCISDPGEILVKQAHAAGITLVPVPGPSAVITALCVSGQDTGRFCFEGFVSTVKKQRREHLESLVQEKRTMIFYEAPHKLLNTLQDFCTYFGTDRKLTIARELTKLHEEIRLTTTGDALAYYQENPPKGEFCLVLQGYTAPPQQEETIDDLAQKALNLMEAEGLSVSEAAKKASAGTKFSKSEVYKAVQQLK